MKNKLTITPGDDMHMNCLMAPYSLNMVVGEDRQHLLAFGKAAFAAGQKSAAHEALQVGQEPALAQYRMAANWNEPRRWTDWDDCSPEAAADYERIKVLHDWEYQVRRLYAAPQPAPDKDAEIAALKDQLANRARQVELDIAMMASATRRRVSKDAEIAALRKDAERLDWLDQNIFPRENLDFKGRLHPTMNMWVMFSPKGHQGSARNILDAAIAQAVQPEGAAS